MDARTVAVGDVLVYPRLGIARVEERLVEGDVVDLTLWLEARYIRLEMHIKLGDPIDLRRPVDAETAGALLNLMRAAPPDPRPVEDQALDLMMAAYEGTLEQQADRVGRHRATIAIGGRRLMHIHVLERVVLGELAFALGRDADALAEELRAHFESRSSVPPSAPRPIRELVAVDATVPWPPQAAPPLDDHEYVGSFSVGSGRLRLGDTAMFGPPFPGDTPRRLADFGTVELPARPGRWHAYLSDEGVRFVHDEANAVVLLSHCGEVGVESGSIAAIDARVTDLPEVRDALRYRMNERAFPWGWAGGTGGDGGFEVHADDCSGAAVVEVGF